MFERFTDDARRVVVLSQEEARLLQHNYIGTEHILLGLLHEGHSVAAQAMESLGVSLEPARAEVAEIIGRGGQSPSGHIPFTPRAKKILEFALREAQRLGHTYIGAEHILLGLVREGEGVATQVLVTLGAELSALRERVMELLGGGAPGPSPGAISTPASLGRMRSDRCVMCRLDLGEVDRYVSGESAAVCDRCIAAAQRALAEAPVDGPHDVLLPLRVVGRDPDDPPAAHEIEHAFRAVFGGPIRPGGGPDPNAALIEDGEALAPFAAQAADRHSAVEITGARVSRIRFLGPDEADVHYIIQIAPAPQAASFDGRAVRRHGHWLVSRGTMVRHLAQAGVQVPSAP